MGSKFVLFGVCPDMSIVCFGCGFYANHNISQSFAKPLSSMLIDELRISNNLLKHDTCIEHCFLQSEGHLGIRWMNFFNGVWWNSVFVVHGMSSSQEAFDEAWLTRRASITTTITSTCLCVLSKNDAKTNMVSEAPRF